MIERFFVGPDALIGPLDGSFRRGISPPAGGEFLCPWRQRNQNAPGDGSDEHSVLIVAFPRTPVYGGRQLGNIVRQRKGAGGSADWLPFYCRCR